MAGVCTLIGGKICPSWCSCICKATFHIFHINYVLVGIFTLHGGKVIVKAKFDFVKTFKPISFGFIKDCLIYAKTSWEDYKFGGKYIEIVN